MQRKLLKTGPLDTTPPLTVEMWQTQRHGGRRLVVKDAAGKQLHDTDDCYDIGDAINRVEIWVRQQATAGLLTEAV
jgi:hypothetical protein